MPAASETHRKLAAILSVDAVGYSRLMQADEPATVETLNVYRAAMRRVIERHKGRVVNAPGDALLAEFASVVEAVSAAVEIQQNIEGRNMELASERRMHFRIGINLGDVIEQDDGTIYGDGVNVAARMEALAEGGGVCVSSSVYDAVEGKVALGFDFLGEQQVKNIAKPVRVYRVRTEMRADSVPQKATRLRKWHWPAIAGVLLLGALAGTGQWLFRSSGVKTPAAPAQGTGRDRIAVLPFANISADPRDEYFADGMTDELISRLSQVRGLDVIARTSVMQYKGKGKSVADIGRELNVQTVLEGSVRKAGDKLRITVQLVNAVDQGHLWSQNYDRELKDVFAIQSDIAQRIAQALNLRLGASELRRIEKEDTLSLEARNAYLLGRYEFNKFTEEGFRRAVAYHEQAIKKDPRYALAYSGLADAYHLLGGWGMDPSSEVIPKAKAAALRALELDPTLGDAQATLAYVRFWYDRDPAGAERDFRRALDLSPNARTQFLWGLYVEFMGRPEEAIKEIERARDLDPLSMIINANVGWAHYCARHYDRAIEEYRRVLQLDSSFAPAHWWLALAYARKKMYEEALAEGRKFAELEKAGPARVGVVGYLHAVSGHRDEALRALQRLEEMSRQQYRTQSWIAYVYVGLADTDRAIQALEADLKDPSENQVVWKVMPEYDPLRSDARFIALLKKLGLER